MANSDKKLSHTPSESKEAMSNRETLAFFELLAGWLIAAQSHECISDANQNDLFCELEELAENLGIDFLL